MEDCNMKSLKVLLPVILMYVTLSGCAPSMSPDVYSREKAQKVQTVHEGKVVMVREVLIEGTKSGLGGIGGGIMGFVLGSAVGKGAGRNIARAGGAIGGALAGSAIEEGVTRQKGLEITVELDNGEVISIVQAADREFRIGDEVNVLRRPDGSARVVQ